MSLLCFGLTKEIKKALVTGKIRYGRAQGEKFAKRKKEPFLFWFLILIFTLFIIISIAFTFYTLNSIIFIF